MINYPKITIITPSFNQGKYIEQTINSVISQNYPNLEYFIIDGGSTDNTIEVIKKHEKHITYWVSEPDKGQSDAINKGLKLASGEIINWLNSDDYYEPNALIKIAAIFIKDKNTKAVCARSRLFRNQNETVCFSNGTDIYPNNIAKTIGWARIDQPETFFHRSAIEKMGPLDVQLNFLMDRDWWIKYLFLFNQDNIVKISDIIVNFRLHQYSKTVAQKNMFQIEYDNWFYSLSKKTRNFNYSTIIKENFDVNESFSIKNMDVIDHLLAEKILSYFFLLRANQFYTVNDKIKTNTLLEEINLTLLSKDDFKLWRKIYFRNKYIPTFIINFFRK